MSKYTIQSVNNMSLRVDHTTSAATREYVPAGTQMHGNDGDLWIAIESGENVQAGDQWLHVRDAGGAPKDGWVAIIHLGRRYCTLAIDDPADPPEPVDLEFGVAQVSYREVFPDGSTGPWQTEEFLPKP